ncbi:pheST operon leader peptide PheM [Mixta calida]|nr:pheST operon leader peptide PheM [Pantoea sp.]QNU45428.1 pheST operon leader peptide PheM [Mixta calida]
MYAIFRFFFYFST